MDLKYYRLFNPDIQNLNDEQLIIHFSENKNEGRVYNLNSFIEKYNDFNIDAYKNWNIDLTNFSDSELCYHYYKYGQYENRICNYLYFIQNNFKFDIEYYFIFNPDLQNLKKVEIYEHFYKNVNNENRIYNYDTFIQYFPEFDIEYYKYFNKDLENCSQIELAHHYYTHGKNETRIFNYNSFISIYKNFDIEYYKKFNKELLFESDFEYIKHYINTGNDINIKYLEFDFNIDKNTSKIEDNHPFLNFIRNHHDFRRIDNYYELFKLNINFKKNFYISNEKTFYDYYSDFDINYYKKKYYSENNNISTFFILKEYHLNNKYLKYIYNSRIKIIIYTPVLDPKSGGILILHYLAKIINDMNSPKYYAKIFNQNNIKYNNYLCNDFASMDEINDNTIIIYPEIVSGNPLNCKNVVRWILLDLGFEMPIDHYIKWGMNDLIYYWESKEIKNKYFKQLCCPYFNDIFINKNLKKTKTCYLIKKGKLIHKNIQYMHQDDSICIDNLSLENISNIFNESTYFYCYDPNTAYILYAAVCGCITIIYPIEEISKEKYFKNRIFNYQDKIYNNGIAYGNIEEEIIFAKNSISNSEEVFKNLYDSYKNTVKYFLDDIEIYFKNINDENISYCKNVFY
jgi:hypothetical protein